jgi:hypothetical protein
LQGFEILNSLKDSFLNLSTSANFTLVTLLEALFIHAQVLPLPGTLSMPAQDTGRLPLLDVVALFF